MEIYIKHNDSNLSYDDFIAIDKECFPNEYFSELQFEEMKNQDFWASYVNGSPAGFLSIKGYSDGIHLSRIGVKKEYRKMGAASELMNTLFKFAKGLEKSYITLLVETTNEQAISLYKKYGFSAVGGKSQFVIPIKRLLLEHEAADALVSAMPVNEYNSYKYDLKFINGDNEVVGKCFLNSEFPGCSYFEIENPDINFIDSLVSLQRFLNKEKDNLILTIEQEPLIDACTRLGFKLNYELIKMRSEVFY